MFEWDEAKRRATIEKHGLDFRDVAELFFREFLELPARSEDEKRRIAIGPIGGITVAAVFVRRGETIRIVTARRARRDEREHYQAHVARRDP